jgi:hypothetical protein
VRVVRIKQGGRSNNAMQRRTQMQMQTRSMSPFRHGNQK